MRELNDWFLNHRREFPWRANVSPYRVWVSEIMLQQTRASVVIPYFERWMSLFPDVESLASAELEQVMKAWEGLGYYNRARNLHEGARCIMKEFGGQIPSTPRELAMIPGIGPYTVGAILSFAFQQRAPAVDGNVARVLARYFLVEDDIGRQKGKKRIAECAERALDAQEPWVTAEALIELGATVCTPLKPRCGICPLRQSCLGQTKAEYLPIKIKAGQTIRLRRIVICLKAEGKILLRKGEKGKVMQDLYEFPYFEAKDAFCAEAEIGERLEKLWGLKVTFTGRLHTTVHTFTKYKAELIPFRFRADQARPVEGYVWIDEKDLGRLPFSSGHRRILHS